MNKADFMHYWNFYMIIAEDLDKTTRYVEHTVDNDNVYSAEFSKIILSSCAEIDTVCRLFCKKIDPNSTFVDSSLRGGDIRNYAETILQVFPKLPQTEIYFTKYYTEKKPWEGWTLTPQYQSPQWWRDYQLIKHYRHEHFRRATLFNALHSTAALYVILLYLHKVEFHFTSGSMMDHPNLFFSRTLLDLDQGEMDAMVELRQLPDFR